MTEPPGGSPDDTPEPKRPYWRNPWVIAFIAGAATLTLLGPFMRHVPDPPPVLGPLDTWVAIDASGRPFGSEQLLGRPYVLTFMGTRCPEMECKGIAAGLERIRSQYEIGEIPIPVVAVLVGESDETPCAELPAIKILRTSVEKARPTLDAIAEFGEVRYEKPRELGFVIVDGQGRLRGLYKTDEPGVDETLHRAMHVLREEKQR